MRHRLLFSIVVVSLVLATGSAAGRRVRLGERSRFP